MKAIPLVLAGIAIIAVSYLWLAPIGPAPGVFIGGTPAEAPADWGDTSQLHEIRLATGLDGIPRVVIVWVVQVDNGLHVVGEKTSGWASRIGDGSPVRMRMEDRTYDLYARRVTEGWEEVLQAYVDKYRADYPDIVSTFPPIEEAAETVAVFRLERSQ